MLTTANPAAADTSPGDRQHLGVNISTHVPQQVGEKNVSLIKLSQPFLFLKRFVLFI